MPDLDDLSHTLAAARLDVDRDLASIHGALISEQLGTRARRGRRKRFGIGLAAIVITVSTTAAGTGVLALRTGTHGQPSRFTEDVDRSEWLNVCAPGYAEVVRKHQPDGPLPGGTSWDVATRALVTQAQSSSYCANGEDSWQQETAIDSGYLFWAQSSWFCAGVDAIHSGERSGWVAAASQLQSIVDSDLMAKVDGGGVRVHDARVASSIKDGKIPLDSDIDCSKVDR